MRNGMKELPERQRTGRLPSCITRNVKRKRAGFNGKHELYLLINGKPWVIIADRDSGYKRQCPEKHQKRQKDDNHPQHKIAQPLPVGCFYFSLTAVKSHFHQFFFKQM